MVAWKKSQERKELFFRRALCKIRRRGLDMQEFISYGHLRCGELAPHKNRGMEITVVEKGHLEWMVEGVAEQVNPGSVFFTLPWQAHGSLQPREPDNLIWHALFHLGERDATPRTSFRFPPTFGFTASESRQLSRVFCSAARHSFPATPALQQWMTALITELQGDRDLRRAHALSLLRSLLVELKRIITGEAGEHPKSSWPEKRVAALIREMAAHCDQDWTLRRMADHCGLQRTRLNTVFQTLTGDTPARHLARLRIERAKSLLCRTHRPVTEIAFDCGFSSSQYFANTFRHATGITPSDYREQWTRQTGSDPRQWANVGFRSEQEERRRIQKFSAN